MNIIDAVWQALANPERRTIIDLLRTQPRTTGAIVEESGLDRFVVQRHLGVLRKAELVLVTARGRERYNTLNASALYQATIGWLHPIDRRYAAVLDNLRKQLESKNKENFMDIQRLHVTQQIDINASAQQCFNALTGDISPWWGSPYLLLNHPQTRIIAGSRLGEIVREHSGKEEASWGTVSELKPHKMIAWTGRIGQGSAVIGTVRFTLSKHKTKTLITLEHESIGAFSSSAQDRYSYGWRDLLHRLQALLEHDEAYGIAGKNTTTPTFKSAETT